MPSSDIRLSWALPQPAADKLLTPNNIQARRREQDAFINS